MYRYFELNTALVKEIPEFRATYDQLIERWGEDYISPHTVYARVLNDFLIEQIPNDTKSEIIKRIFHFIERLANSNDTDVRDLVQVTICERLGSDVTILKAARKLMGPKTRELSHEIEVKLRGFDPAD